VRINEVSLRWRVHPLVEQPAKSLALIVILAGILVIVQLSFGEPGWTVVSGVLLFAWLARYFFPTTYECGEEGVRVGFLGFVRERRWGEFRRFEVYRTGIHLSPFAKPNILDNFRGLFMLFHNNRDEVVEFVGGKIKSGGDARAQEHSGKA
jgi:hypothetical protein